MACHADGLRALNFINIEHFTATENATVHGFIADGKYLLHILAQHLADFRGMHGRRAHFKGFQRQAVFSMGGNPDVAALYQLLKQIVSAGLRQFKGFADLVQLHSLRVLRKQLQQLQAPLQGTVDCLCHKLASLRSYI